MNKDEKHINNLEAKLQDIKDNIRYNGIFIERLEDRVAFLAGEIRDMKNMQNDISTIKEEISILPVIKTVIKKHSKQLAGLTN